MTESIVLDHINKTDLKHDNFASRVDLLLTSRGATKCWLAKELGISRQALNHILKHGKKPRFISELALIFNVSPKWLETGQGKVYITSRTLCKTIPLYELTALLSCKTLSDAKCIDKVLLNIADNPQYFAVFLDNTKHFPLYR